MTGLMPWDPFSGLTSLHGQIDDMFNGMLGSSLPSLSSSSPAMDIYTENDKSLVTEVHAPGFSKDDIDINVRSGVLEIKGEKHQKDESKAKRNYMRRDSYTSFYRSIALPKTADGEKVKASFDDGILKVTVPLKELPAPRKIAIDSDKKK
jgi:HSP20 family protein